MIYTLGYAPYYIANYNESIEKGIPYLKTGRRGTYNGGFVWQTQEEVQEWIDKHPDRFKGYAVFGVEADWEKDTVKPTITSLTEIADRPWHNLLRDSPIRLIDGVDYEGIVKGVKK